MSSSFCRRAQRVDGSYPVSVARDKLLGRDGSGSDRRYVCCLAEVLRQFAGASERRGEHVVGDLRQILASWITSDRYDDDAAGDAPSGAFREMVSDCPDQAAISVGRVAIG